MNKYEKLYDFLLEKHMDSMLNPHGLVVFAAVQVSLVARNIRDKRLHDDTCSFISSPMFSDDKEISLPEFLYFDDDKRIFVGTWGDTDVTELWNDWLNTYIR